MDETKQTNETATKFQKVCTAIGELANACVNVTIAFKDFLTPAIKELLKVFDTVKVYYLAKDCPNKRVLHLARYSKKYRTQKKNINRLKKWIKKEGI